jgi:two-component system phosphate regulon response regulator PhoB
VQHVEALHPLLNKAGPLTIDRAAHWVSVDGRGLDLTTTEYALLLTLAERRGRVQSRSQLLQTVWKANPSIQTRTVDMHMQRLRSKLGPAAHFLETIRGFGYRFRAAEPGKRRQT